VQFGSAYKKPIASSNSSRENPYRKFEFSIPRHPVLCIFISGDISQESRKYARFDALLNEPNYGESLGTTLSRVFEDLFLCSLLGQFGSE
jgi:hypothetical protein